MKTFFKYLFTIAILTAAFTCFAQAKGKVNDLRILYWNIQNGMWADQQNDYNNFVEFVKSCNPDICVWCEAESRYVSGTCTKMTIPEDQYLPYNWDILAGRYGHKYAVICGKRDTFPQVITSRFPIVVEKRIKGDGNNIIVVHGAGQAYVVAGNDTIRIVTLHTWPQKYEYNAKDTQKSAEEQGGDVFRSVEMQYVCEQTIGQDSEADRHLWMMLGDFNALSSLDNHHWNKSLSDKCYLTNDYILNNTPYIDIVAETYPGEFQKSTNSGKRIDFIYMTEPLFSKVKEVKFLYDGFPSSTRLGKDMHNFCVPSDHYPIFVILDMNRRKPGK